MRHALIIAGGSGTRLWPMSRADLPKQLIPFIGGRSLLQTAIERLHGLVPDEQIHICAGLAHRDLILPLLKGKGAAERFIGEPMGRDTLNAVGLGAAVIGRRDRDAVIAVFTADHLIEPVNEFRRIVQQGYALAEQSADTLVTFGIKPTHAATGYGYLQLGQPVEAGSIARVVEVFKEKPDEATAAQYLVAGPQRYLWNSGMFVWRAATLMDCIGRFAPENHRGLVQLGDAWAGKERDTVLAQVYPTLRKISVDFAVMEPASRDRSLRVVAVPMPLSWLDVGSWPAFGQAIAKDEDANAVSGARHLGVDSRGNVVASSAAGHVIATIGCENLVIIHTPDATLVCRADRAEDIKKLHEMVGKKFGAELI